MSKKKKGIEWRKLSQEQVDTLLHNGVVQELNRQFLHPLGMAIMVTAETNGSNAVVSIAAAGDSFTPIEFDPAHLSDSKRVRFRQAMDEAFERTTWEFGRRGPQDVPRPPSSSFSANESSLRSEIAETKKRIEELQGVVDRLVAGIGLNSEI